MEVTAAVERAAETVAAAMVGVTAVVAMAVAKEEEAMAVAMGAAAREVELVAGPELEVVRGRLIVSTRRAQRALCASGFLSWRGGA